MNVEGMRRIPDENSEVERNGSVGIWVIEAARWPDGTSSLIIN